MRRLNGAAHTIGMLVLLNEAVIRGWLHQGEPRTQVLFVVVLGMLGVEGAKDFAMRMWADALARSLPPADEEPDP